MNKLPRYRTALISEELRYEISSIVSGNSIEELKSFLDDPRGAWVHASFISSDQAVRANIQELSGERYADGVPHPRWAEISERLAFEPAQIEWRREQGERSAKRKQSRAVTD